jgi:hypothetical protein
MTTDVAMAVLMTIRNDSSEIKIFGKQTLRIAHGHGRNRRPPHLNAAIPDSTT